MQGCVLHYIQKTKKMGDQLINKHLLWSKEWKAETVIRSQVRAPSQHCREECDVHYMMKMRKWITVWTGQKPLTHSITIHLSADTSQLDEEIWSMRSSVFCGQASPPHLKPSSGCLVLQKGSRGLAPYCRDREDLYHILTFTHRHIIWSNCAATSKPVCSCVSHRGFLDLSSVTRPSLWSICSANQHSSNVSSTGHPVPIFVYVWKSKKKKKKKKTS